jgi:hypothetical protein
MLALRIGWGVLVALVCLGPATASPEPIAVLMVGQVFPYETPVAGWLENDPAFEYVVVPVRRDTGGWTNYPEEEARRYVRLYFPRTYGSLLSYDFLCYVDTYFAHLAGTQIDMMYRAISEEGVGGLSTLGGGISWVPEYRQSWVSSRVGSAFPTDYVQPPDQVNYIYDFRIAVSDSASPAPVFGPFLALGIEEQLGRQAAELVAKEGSNTHATLRAPGAEGMPFAVDWRYGRGTTWSIATDIQTDYNLFWTQWGTGHGFQYAMDLFLNIVLHASGREVLQDILRFHEVREKFSIYRETKSMLSSLLDFVEAFGANRQALDREMEEVEVTYEEARALYVEQDIEAASDAMDAVFEELDRISGLSIRLKNNALLWIYLIEWISVTGALMVSGSILWTLMVRRRAYRSIGTTRFT